MRSGRRGSSGWQMTGQLAAAELGLQEAMEEVKVSNRDKEELQLEREELRVELALMQAQVQRLEGTGSVEDSCGGTVGGTTISTGRERELWHR